MRNRIREIVSGIIEDLYDCRVDFDVQYPPSEDLGDYSTNAAFLLASELDRNPNDVADEICSRIESEIIDSAAVAGGFINIRIKKEVFIDELRKAGEDEYFGNSSMGEGKRTLVEFVSVNPTGPITVAHARAAAFGDSLARIMKSQGYRVDTEYYFNDAGRQIELLGESIRLREKELNGEDVDFPENGYQGDYITALARDARKEKPSSYKDFGVKKMLDLEKKTLERFRVHFDNWVREQSFYEKGEVEKVINDLDSLENSPFIRKEGALWFTEGDRERVFIRSDGTYTYIVPDIAYHRYKFERDYGKLINLLGPDHIDHIPELESALELLGYPVSNLETKIIQWVTLKRGKKKVKMSKRKGEFITLDELVDEVGVDAARFIFLTRKSSMPMDFDIELAKEQSERNPVYYVQYGHARICSLLDHAEEEGYSSDSQADIEKLTGSQELSLIRKIPGFREVLVDIVETGEPHLLTNYLLELVKVYHNFYQKVRIVGGEKELIEPRLYLSGAIKNIIGRGLGLLGVEAPKRM